MPYTADYELIDFEVDRPDESNGDEPYLIAIYWAIDGNISVVPGTPGTQPSLRGTPQMVFRGGDHENITRRSLTAADGPVSIPGAVGQASIRLLEFAPPFTAVQPIAGMTVVAMEEDNTPDGWVNDVMSDIRTGIPSFAASFVSSLTIDALGADRAATFDAFEAALRGEIKSITKKSVARKIGRSLLFGLFAAADADNEIGTANAQVTASAAGTVRTDPPIQLVFEQRPGARYIINARITVTPEPMTRPPIFVDIDFFGRDDDRNDELLDPPESSFPIEPGRPVSRTFRWGGELRVEYDFNVVAGEDEPTDLHLTVNGRLFEGDHELNRDLDDSGSITVSARAGTTNRSELLLENSEWRSDDMARLEVALRNGV